MKLRICIIAVILFPMHLSVKEANGNVNNHFRLIDKEHHLDLVIEPEKGITFFGLDSEGSGREQTNLLSEPVKLSWDGSGDISALWRQTAENKFDAAIKSGQGKDAIKWSVVEDQGDMLWVVENSGREVIQNLKIEIPVSSLLAAAALIPSGIDKTNHGMGPWLLVVPDFGQLLIKSESDIQLLGINSGVRGSGSNAVSTGVDPRLRGQKWLDATGIRDFKPGKLNLRIATIEPMKYGQRLVLRFQKSGLLQPEGIERTIWEKMRRSYINQWQPCGTWAGAKKEMVLSNNVLSDPASVTLSQYADPMLFVQKPVEGIDMSVLLRHSLEYYLDNEVSADGHVNAFGKMHDMYVSTGASLLISAWDYWTISNDKPWLGKRIQKLHLVADYLLRRDIDNDGLIESIGSGNAGSLRDPDGADVWFEFMNFGFKNTWTNLLSYRAFLCLAEMLGEMEEHDGAVYYREKAEILRQSFEKQFYSKANGWFVSWISLDGKVHDYCHTFINGMAVAYGIVPPDKGRIILGKVVAKSKTLGFTNWHLGVPANLLPARKEDLVGPRIGMNGKPVRNDFYWPDNLTEEASFGNRYPNGTIHPALVWHYLLGLQVAELHEEADRIMEAMLGSAQEGLFQNGIVNVGYGGAEHFYSNGKTCGYEGYLPESFNFLMAFFTRDLKLRDKFLHPMVTTQQKKKKTSL